MINKFLKGTGVKTEEDAMRNSIVAALQHNPTYRADVTYKQKDAFRKSLSDSLRKCAPNYNNVVSDEEHIKVINKICQSLSAQHSQILRNSRLRVGTVQKALNLYLKFLWCLDQKRAVPPHCPIDRNILAEAGLDESWTKLDSIEIYMSWVSQLRRVAQEKGCQSLQLWELSVWNKKSLNNK